MKNWKLRIVRRIGGDGYVVSGYVPSKMLLVGLDVTDNFYILPTFAEAVEFVRTVASLLRGGTGWMPDACDLAYELALRRAA